MRSQLTKKALALCLAVAAPIGICLTQASYAGNDGSSATLIDKEFEAAMRKFVTKRFYNRIDATDEQRAKLDNLFSGAMDETRPAREQFRHSLLDLSALMASDEATDDQITEKVHEVRALKEKIMDQRLSTALKGRKILTHEQKQQIHNRIYELITGGIKPRKLSMLLEQ